jgi:hypothetical protein
MSSDADTKPMPSISIVHMEPPLYFVQLVSFNNFHAIIVSSITIALCRIK